MTVVEEVKQKLDIVALVSEHTQLHKSGKNFRGLCPFHSEKDPSFYVYPDQGTWHCFGRCQAGGDILAFVMKRENLSFGEALRALAEQAGVRLTPQPEAEAQAREREGAHRLNEAAADYYHRLLVDSPAGEAARGYLKKRGVTIETVLDFKLGYAPASHHSLHPHLEGLGFSRQEVLGAGLARQSDDGTVHDLFRHRLLFPIRDASGKLCGFGGRALDDATPKYLNSPATPVFDKRSLLYALDRAREAIRKVDRAVIVEGYMDALIAHQAGFAETVATMGVALTQNHLLALKRLTRNLVLALDADEAGVEATLKGVEVAASALGDKETLVVGPRVVRYERILDAEIRVLVLPQGQDPDEVILQDPSQWQHFLDTAPPVMEFLLNALDAQVGEDAGWDEKEVLVMRLRPLFDEIKEPIRWSHYAEQLSRRLGVDKRQLIQTLRSRAESSWRGLRSSTLAPPTSRPGLEEYSLALCLNFPELREAAKELSPELFEDSLNRELFRHWREMPDVAALREGMEEPLREHLDQVLARPLPSLPPEKRQAAFQQARLRLRERHLRQALAAQRDALSPAPGARAEGATPAEPPGTVPLDSLAALEEKEASLQLKQVFLERRSLSRKTMP